MYKKIQFHIKGISPILLHNGRLADPLYPIVAEIKKISQKRKKTEADLLALARLEWMGSLYLKNGKIVLPGEVMEASLISGAKKKRQGQQAKIAIFVENESELIYDGPKDLEELWENDDFRLTTGVVIQRSRVMRTRPKFNKWEAKVVVTYEDTIIDRASVIEFMELVGSQVGLCDWRPKFGRFQVLEVNDVE